MDVVHLRHPLTPYRPPNERDPFQLCTFIPSTHS
jgi:hypothetical protein